MREILEQQREEELGYIREHPEYFVETYPEIVDKVSKKEIASYLNMTPESLSRVLKKYKELHG